MLENVCVGEGGCGGGEGGSAGVAPGAEVGNAGVEIYDAELRGTLTGLGRPSSCADEKGVDVEESGAEVKLFLPMYSFIYIYIYTPI